MSLQLTTLAFLAISIPAMAFPPLSCEARVEDRFWGLELLGSVAVWHTPQNRETVAIVQTLTLSGPEKRMLYVIEQEEQVHLASASETACLRNGLTFPVSLIVLSLDDANQPLRTACCTVAE